MPAIGLVRKQPDGSFTGELSTLTIRTPITIKPIALQERDRSADYKVFASDCVEIGTANIQVGKSSEAQYIALALASPEFGPRILRVNLGRAPGQNDPNVFAIIWNPED